MRILSIRPILALLGVTVFAGASTWAAAQTKGPPPGLTLAEKGYWVLLNQPLGPPLLTEPEYDRLWTVWPEPLRGQAERAAPAERRRMALQCYGFQQSPDRPAGAIPQQFTADGEGRLMFNCLGCHGGKVAGKVVRGLGNSHFDEGAFVADLVRLTAAEGRQPPPHPPAAPTPGLMRVRGVNNAFGEALAFLSVRDRELNLTPDRAQFPAPDAAGLEIPVDTPPYWFAHRKRFFYYDGFIAKTHRGIMQFSCEYALPGAQIRGWENDFKAILAWIESVRAPAYPWAIDRELAARGRPVYMQQCARCHGSGGGADDYPERLIDVASVGSDPVRAALSVPFKKHLAAGWLGNDGQVELRTDRVAYVAPPLDGVWATAPYLHNGSVPTVWHLLNPDRRPAVWRRSEDGYDRTRLGLEAQEFDRLPASATTPDERRQYYQTELHGLGNGGHRYPAGGLSADETRSLMEYLKTL